MCDFWRVALLLAASSLATQATEIKVLPEQITVYEGDGFLFRLDHEGPLKNCELERFGTLEIGENTTSVEGLGEIVRSFGDDRCGVRVTGARKATSEGTWTLSATLENGDKVKSSTTVTVLPKMPCNGDYCIYPTGWTFGRGRLLNCPPDAPGVIKRCVVNHASLREPFEVKEGRQWERYSAHMSVFKEGVCEFEIPFPSMESELGFWNMTIEVENDLSGYMVLPKDAPRTSTKTCGFLLYDGRKTTRRRLVQRAQSPVVIKTVKPRTKIACAENTGYKINSCYLTNGHDFEFNTDSFMLENELCYFEVTPGNWTCGFSGLSEKDEDFIQKFEVIQIYYELIDEGVTVDGSGETSLECHLIDKRPIQQCLLVSPSGKIFRPISDSFKSPQFSYLKGGSMRRGDCGVTFAAGVDVEAGDWRCIVVDEDNKSVSVPIEKPRSNFTQ